MIINMKNKLAVLLILLGMVGTAAASNCPESWNKDIDNRVVVLEETNGNVVTYHVKSNVATIITDPAIAGFKALCIRPEGGFLGSEADLDAIPAWDENIKLNDIVFFARGNPDNLLFDNVNHKVGTVDYSDHSAPPEKVETLVHVISKEICGGTDENPNTCFVRPGKPTIPVPELNSVILISVGLLGLGLVVRKYKR